MPSWKQNAPGLNMRNVRTSLRDSHFGFHDFLYHLQSWIWVLISIGELPQLHAFDRGKPLSIFADRSVIGNQSSDACTQQVGEAKIFQPGSAFQIGRTNGISIIIV